MTGAAMVVGSKERRVRVLELELVSVMVSVTVTVVPFRSLVSVTPVQEEPTRYPLARSPALSPELLCKSLPKRRAHAPGPRKEPHAPTSKNKTSEWLTQTSRVLPVIFLPLVDVPKFPRALLLPSVTPAGQPDPQTVEPVGVASLLPCALRRERWRREKKKSKCCGGWEMH
jgi:hypothetical protein